MLNLLYQLAYIIGKVHYISDVILLVKMELGFKFHLILWTTMALLGL
jgi:hypothetical protein